MQLEEVKKLGEDLRDNISTDGKFSAEVKDLMTVARQAYGDALVSSKVGDFKFEAELLKVGLTLARRVSHILNAASNERNYLELQARHPVSERRALLMSNTIQVVEDGGNITKNYFGHCGDAIVELFGRETKRILHIPFASVGAGAYDASSARAAVRFKELGYEIVPIQQSEDPMRALKDAEGIFVSGGNTHHLMYELLSRGLLPVVRERVFNGVPYLGTSAGANVGLFSVGASNDWRWKDVPLTNAIGIIPGPVILNPHRPAEEDPLHGGETREERAKELLRGLDTGLACFPQAMPAVLTLSEGVWLKLEGGSLSLFGQNRNGQSAEIFYQDGRSVPLMPMGGAELNTLLPST